MLVIKSIKTARTVNAGIVSGQLASLWPYIYTNCEQDSDGVTTLVTLWHLRVFSSFYYMYNHRRS